MAEDLNVESARGILKDLIKDDARAMLPEKIRLETARYYKVKICDIDSKKRNADIALPRMAAMYLIRNNTDLSFADIGKLFGGRNHSTVMHAVEKVENRIHDDMQIRNAVGAIMEQVKRRK